MFSKNKNKGKQEKENQVLGEKLKDNEKEQLDKYMNVLWCVHTHKYTHNILCVHVC